MGIISRLREESKKQRELKTVLIDKKLQLKYIIIAASFMFLPFFLDMEFVYTDETIKYYIEYFSTLFPAIENRALVSAETDNYKFSRFIGVYSLFVCIIIFLVSLYDYSKYYVYNLKFVSFKTKKYYNEAIDKYKMSIPHYSIFLVYILMSIFCIYFIFYIESASSESFLNRRFFSSELGIVIFYMFMSAVGSFFSYMLLEILARIYKIYNNKTTW